VSRKINPVAYYFNTLSPKRLNLFLFAESKATNRAIRADNPVTGHIRDKGVFVQSITDRAGGAGRTDGAG